MLSPDFDAQSVLILVSDSDLDTIVNVAVIPLGIEHNRTASTPISKVSVRRGPSGQADADDLSGAV